MNPAFKATNGKKIFFYKGSVRRTVFEVAYSDRKDFRFMSYTPHEQDYFLGELIIRAGRTVPWSYLPQQGARLYELLRGEVVFLVTRGKRQLHREKLSEAGETVVFSGVSLSEIQNERNGEEARIKIFTVPSFL